MSIQLLDVYADNKVNFAEEKAVGVDGVIIKAGQGQYGEYFDKKCTFIDQVKALDLPWGIYWIVDARYSPESQKAALKQYFPDGNFGPLGLWLDVEKPVISMPEWYYKRLPYAFYKPIESIAQAMLDWSKTGLGIYTSPGQWQLCSGNIPLAKMEWFAKLPLWSAQYKTVEPDLYGAWTKAMLKMWQYQGEPDYSIILDEKWWFDKLAIAPPVVTPPTPTQPPLPLPKMWTIAEQTDLIIRLVKE